MVHAFPGYVLRKKEHDEHTQKPISPPRDFISRRQRRLLAFAFVLLSCFLAARIAGAQATVETTSSTQFLFGPDALDGDQNILSQYMRLSVTPVGKEVSVTGYGRIWKDFGAPAVRSDDGLGRLYYLYADYAPSAVLSFRAGRQWVNYTAGTSILDGLTANVDLSRISRLPIAVTLSGGRNVVYSLDSEYSQSGNLFFGMDIHLVNVRLTQLGLSYVQTFDEYDRARQEFGLNFRRVIGMASPYGEVRYDRLDNVIDEATLGVDVFPTVDLMVKGEYYFVYPKFDATDIYSVFAVDKYQEYRLRAEYNLESRLKIPVSVFGSYSWQDYSEDDTANVFTIGSKIRPEDNISLTADVSDQEGFAGHLVGFDVSCDYQPVKKLMLSGGAQFDTYEKPVFITTIPDVQSDDSATRLWIGADYSLKKNLSCAARMEEDSNPDFSHQTLGRLILNWQM